MKRLGPSALIGFALLALASPRLTFAQEDGRRASAKTLKDAGADAMARGHYELALDRFRAAYEIYPSPNLRYNLGLALTSLDRHLEALAELEAFLEGAPDAPAEARAFAQAKIAELDPRFGHLQIIHDLEGAEVVIGGKPAGLTPLPRAVRLEPGTYHVVAGKEGYHPYETRVVIAAGETRRLEVTLKPGAEAGASRGTRKGKWKWVAAGAAGVMLVSGVIVGLHARSVYDEYQQATTQAELDDLAGQVRTESTVANIFFVGAGVAAITSVLMIVFEAREGEPLRALGVSPTLGGASMTFGGTF